MITDIQNSQYGAHGYNTTLMNTYTKHFEDTKGNSFARIEIDFHNKVIIDTWMGEFGSYENYKQVNTYILSQIERHRLDTWLSNYTHLESSLEHTAAWVRHELIPNVIAAGLRFKAIVRPKELTEKQLTKENSFDLGFFALQYFDSFTDAKAWLSNIN